MNELVSIITPTHNSERYIPETIETVKNQLYTHWEHIIIDDGSTDDTVKIIYKYANTDNRIKIHVLNKNLGPAYARNVGIDAAKGCYIAFLDSDDLWHSEKLQKQIAFMKDNKCVLSYTAYQRMRECGKLINSVIKVPKKTNYKQMLNSSVMGCLTVMYDATRLGKVKMPMVEKQEDYALWLKILRNGYDAHGINKVLAYYRIRKKSVSSNKLKVAKYQWKIYRELEELSILRSSYHFMSYAYNGYKKRNGNNEY